MKSILILFYFVTEEMTEVEKQIERIKITCKGENDLKLVKVRLRMLPIETLTQIESAENTLLGTTCTLGKPNRDGFYDIPKECTHGYEHKDNLYFAMPNHCLIIPKGKNVKFNIGK